jgi:S1-C subfamily serine protease
VASAEDLPYQRWLGLAGLELRTAEHRRTSLGFSASRDETGVLVVRGVDPDSGAWRAGLRPDDVIVSWNGAEAPRDVERWAYSQRKGAIVRLTVRREDKSLALDVPLGEAVEISYRVEEDWQAGDKARRIRDGILRGVTQPVKASLR